MSLPPELDAAIEKAYADGSIFSDNRIGRPTDEELASALEHVDKMDFNEVATEGPLVLAQKVIVSAEAADYPELLAEAIKQTREVMAHRVEQDGYKAVGPAFFSFYIEQAVLPREP